MEEMACMNIVEKELEWEWLDCATSDGVDADDQARQVHLALCANRKWKYDVKLLRNAMEEGDKSIIQRHLMECSWIEPWSLVPVAAECGLLDVVKHFWVLGESVSVGIDVMASAIGAAVHGGQLEVVEWLHENVEHGWTKKTMDEAARYGWLELVQWLNENRSEGCSTKAMDWAAVNGHLCVVKWLHSNRTEGCTTAALTYSAGKGHLDVVKWLHENRNEGCTDDALDYVSGNGHWETLKWWVKNRKERSCSSLAMDLAAANGNLKMVEWLHSNGRGECSTSAMDWAAKRGHLEVVQWLHANREEGCTIEALSLAARNGHLEVVQWLNLNRMREWASPLAIAEAVEHGHLPVVKWLFNYCTHVSIIDATLNGHLHVVKWLHSLGSECTAQAMNNAAKHGHLDMVQWFHANSLEGCTTEAMDGAAENGHLEMVQWLHTNRKDGCTTEAMDRAATNGHLAVIKWLHAHRTEGCTTKAMDQAATNGHFAVVQWLHSNREEGCTKSAMDGAALNGFLGMVQWLHRNRHEGCTANAMDKVAENGHIPIVLWWLQVNQNEVCSVEVIDAAAAEQHWDLVEWLLTNRRERCSSLALTRAVMDRRLRIVRTLYDRDEFVTWPRPAHVDLLLQLLLSDNPNDEVLLNHIVRCRHKRYHTDALENPAVYFKVDDSEPWGGFFEASEPLLETEDSESKWWPPEDPRRRLVEYKSFVLTAVAKVCDRWRLAEEIAKNLVTFIISGPPEFPNRENHAKHGWLYWSLRFSEYPSLDMTIVAEHSSLDAAKFMHDRLQDQHRLHCTKRFMYLTMEKGDLAFIMWHVLNCSAHSIRENFYLAVWIGRMDVVEWMRETWLNLSKLPKRNHTFYEEEHGLFFSHAFFHSLDASFEVVGKHFVLETADAEAIVTYLLQRPSDEPSQRWRVYRQKHNRSIVLDLAAASGRLDVVIDCSTSWNPVTCTVTGLYGAIIRGHVGVVRYVYQHQPELSVWPRAEDGAIVLRRLIAEDHTEMLAFLRQERNMRLESRDLYDAVLQRNLGRLRLICALDLVEISADATDLAAVRGDIELLAALQTGLEGLQCSPRALDGAAEEGHLPSVQYLHEHGASCTRQAIDLAARNGHEDVTRFLFEHRHEGCSPYALYWACINSHVGVVKYFASKMIQCDIDKCIAAAETLENEEIVEVLNAYRQSYKAKFDLYRSKRGLSRRSTPIQVRKDVTSTRTVYGMIKRRLWPDGAPSDA